VTDVVTNYWDRLDCPPYIKSLSKYITPPSTVSTARKVEDYPLTTTTLSKKQQTSSSTITGETEGGEIRSESPGIPAFTQRLAFGP